VAKRSTPSTEELLELMRHLADVAALKDDPPAQRQLLVDGLNRLVGTNQAFFFAADGWNRRSTPRFVHQTLGRDQDGVFLKYMSEFGVRHPLTADPFCECSLDDRRTMQTRTFDDVLPDRATERRFEPFMEIRREGRVTDGVVSFFRDERGGSGDDRIIGLGMHQFGAAPRLRPRQRALVEFAMNEVRRLVERGHLSIPPEEAAGLPPRLAQIRDRLLAGQVPKRIARELGLSIWTVRDHIQRLYRHFGVSGRDELMARFVGESSRAPAAVTSSPAASAPPARSAP
jgi:DNA-binding CsgD family transcriptional regulator